MAGRMSWDTRPSIIRNRATSDGVISPTWCEVPMATAIAQRGPAKDSLL